jgi:hypothetical protein
VTPESFSANDSTSRGRGVAGVSVTWLAANGNGVERDMVNGHGD